MTVNITFFHKSKTKQISISIMNLWKCRVTCENTHICVCAKKSFSAAMGTMATWLIPRFVYYLGRDKFFPGWWYFSGKQRTRRPKQKCFPPISCLLYKERCELFFFSRWMFVEMKAAILLMVFILEFLSSLLFCFLVRCGGWAIDSMQGCPTRRFRSTQSYNWICFSDRSWASGSWLFSKN